MGTEIEGFSNRALKDLAWRLKQSGVGTAPVEVHVSPPAVHIEPSTVDLSPVAEAIGRMTGTLTGRLDALVEAVSNPTATAGSEFFRRGALAYQNGWNEEARADLRQAVEEYPYRAGPHFFAGLVELRLGDAAAAMEAFRLAVRYGPGGDASSAVTAALVGNYLALGAGVPSQGATLLQEAASTLPLSFEIQWALSALHDQESARDPLARSILVLELPANSALLVHCGSAFADLRRQFSDQAQRLFELHRVILMAVPADRIHRPDLRDPEPNPPPMDDFEWCRWFAHRASQLRQVLKNWSTIEGWIAGSITQRHNQIESNRQFLDTPRREHDRNTRRDHRKYRGAVGRAKWEAEIEARSRGLERAEREIPLLGSLAAQWREIAEAVVPSFPHPGQVPTVSALDGFDPADVKAP